MPDTPVSSVSRTAAADMLGVPPEMTPTEARAVFLKRLQTADFQPPEQWCAGYTVLSATEPAGGLRFGAAAIEQARRDELRRDVDEFIRDYWSLDCAPRKARWNSLWQRCTGNHAIRKHLQHLSAALNLAFVVFDNSERPLAKIAQCIQETFPLWPYERLARRREWLLALPEYARPWSDAAKQLENDFPSLADLGPVLLRMIHGLQYRESDHLLLMRKPIVEPIPQNKASSDKDPKVTWWPILFGFAILMKFLASLGSSSTSSRDPSPSRDGYRFQAPVYKIPADTPTERKAERDRLNKKYELDNYDFLSPEQKMALPRYGPPPNASKERLPENNPGAPP